jgi:hypothetical protein
VFVASYPTGLDKYIKKHLIRHRAEMAKIYRQSKSKLSKIFKLLHKRKDSIDAGKIGELLGGFAKGMIS